MKTHKVTNLAGSKVFMLSVLVLISCSSYNTIIKMPQVKEIPPGQYDRIIKLNNPEGAPYETLAGLVFIKKGANVCTDYPRQEIIKSLDDLTMTDKTTYQYSIYSAMMAEAETLGFVSIPVEYRAILWKNERDENCKYKVRIEYINEDRGNFGGEGNESGHGGHGR